MHPRPIPAPEPVDRRPSVAVAIALAILAGLGSCAASVVPVFNTMTSPARRSLPSGAKVPDELLQFVPFLIGGAIAAIVYRLMLREPSAAPIEAGSVRPTPVLADPGPSPSALPLAASIVGACMLLGVSLGAAILHFINGSGPPLYSWSEALHKAGLPGALIGLVVGLLLAIPAAILVTVTRRSN